MPPSVNERKRKPNGTFARGIKPRENKRRRVSSSEQETESKNIATESSKWSWREGRRIVELGFLADQLKKGCSECKKVSNLTNIVDETIQGLGLILYIQCEGCSHRSPEKMSVGRPIWDINTKAATGLPNLLSLLCCLFYLSLF